MAVTILGDKSVWQSWTFYGALALGIGQLLEQSGALIPGTTIAVTTLSNAIGAFLGTMGIRRALGPAPV